MIISIEELLKENTEEVNLKIAPREIKVGVVYPIYGMITAIDISEELGKVTVELNKHILVELNMQSQEKIDLLNTKSTREECCKVRIYDIGTLKAYRFAVVFARYRNKWLYCRAKERDTFETAGGNIDSDETPLEAAKRELYEETGAIKFDIEPAFDFTAHTSKDNYSWYANTQVFLAHIHELGEIPDFEMAEVKLFDAMPDKMRFPQILPVVYEKMQMRLNEKAKENENDNNE
jgi:8-oxo-dGTP diphosphatase